MSHPLTPGSEGSLEDWPVAWHPTAEQIEAANLTRFLRKYGLADLNELLERSVADPDWFYPTMLEELDFRWFEPYKAVVDVSRGIQWPEWFPGGRTNLVLNAIDKHIANGRGDWPAIFWEGDDGSSRSLTYAQFDDEVRRLAAGLKKLGVGVGDRVGIFLPMLPETPAALMACARIGAILTPIFSGFAAEAVATRLADCDAKVLITADGFYRRGRKVAMKEVADAACRSVPSIEHVVVVRRTGDPVPWTEGRDIYYDELTAIEPMPGAAESMGANDPFMIIYTSGTTGRPKGAVHTHTGFPLKAMIDLYFCLDIKPDDRIFWLTDIGWMMGPWLFLGSTLFGATMVLFEGTPDYPTPARLWELVERYKITLMGIAPTAVRALMAQGDEWVARHDLSSLRILGSTGEPWNPKPWLWFLERVGGGRCPIINYSGGTEIGGGIVGCYPTMPLKPCSFHGAIPGINADVVDDQARPLRNGAVGELVIRNVWAGMTKSFWGDDERYLETYWSRWPDIWKHGDLAVVDSAGYWYILGRSDDTIMVAGKRVGPAEIESALASHPAVREAAAIGVPHEVKGETIVAFVVPRPGYETGPELRQELLDHVTQRMGRALQPGDVYFVSDLPRTRSAKVMRRLIKAKYLGKDLGDTSSLENPEALNEIVTMASQASQD